MRQIELILAIGKELDTTSCETAVTGANHLLPFVAPVFLGLVEVGHTVYTHLGGDVAVCKPSLYEDHNRWDSLATFLHQQL